MILRKPYAFLIRHFKLIHLFICLLIIYLINKTNNILNFFKDYINDDIFEIVPSSYVDFRIYLSLFLIIGLVITIVILMRKKDKPLFFYIMTIVFYSALFIGFSYIGVVINTLQFNLLDRQSISLVRDITRIMLIIECIFLVPYIIRGLGFDIKKFDFKRDLQELNIVEEDNEEFELLSPVNMDKVSQAGRRKVRELKYYYIENRLFILIILSIVFIVSIFAIFNNIDFGSRKRYEESEIIKLENFYTLKIDDSYITTKSDTGKVVAVNNNFYLIVKFIVNSTYDGVFTLDTSKFIVSIDDEKFIPGRMYYSYFSSYGIGYRNQSFSLNDNKSYILVYNIPNAYKEKEMLLEYNYRYDYSESEAEMIKKVVELDPEIKN